MNAEEIINYIATSDKKTPVKLYVREKPGCKIDYAADAAKSEVKVFGGRKGKIVFGDWADLAPVLEANADAIDYYEVETTAGIRLCRCWIKKPSTRVSSPAPSSATWLRSAIMP